MTTSLSDFEICLDTMVSDEFDRSYRQKAYNEALQMYDEQKDKLDEAKRALNIIRSYRGIGKDSNFEQFFKETARRALEKLQK